MTFVRRDTPFLPDWEWSFNPGMISWAGMTAKSENLRSAIGQGGVFRDHMMEAKQILSNFDREKFASSLKHRGMIRAFIQTWLENSSLAKETLNQVTLSQLINAPAGITRLASMAIIQLHLSYFGELDQWEHNLFETSKSAVYQAIEMQKVNSRFVDIVESARTNPNLIVDRLGPENIATLLVDGGQTLEGLFADLKLHGLRSGSFRSLVQHAVYLRRIQSADPAIPHDFLGELGSETLRKTTGPDGRYFGLSLLEALTDKAGQKPSPQWIDTILSIGGDPRMTFTHVWSTWWQPVSQGARETMSRWLSDQDLTLFLRAIAEFGNKSRNAEILRMYPDREKFLRGLQSAGLIRETRLYMGSQARDYIKSVLTKTQARTITRLVGQADTSIIFVDCGDFHIVEGSHSFKIWIYPGRPVKELTDRSRYSVHINEFRNELPNQYGDASHLVEGITHSVSPGTWQYKALRIMVRRYGAQLEPYRMMTQKSYDAMRHRDGMP